MNRWFDFWRRGSVVLVLLSWGRVCMILKRIGASSFLCSGVAKLEERNTEVFLVD